MDTIIINIIFILIIIKGPSPLPWKDHQLCRRPASVVSSLQTHCSFPTHCSKFFTKYDK